MEGGRTGRARRNDAIVLMAVGARYRALLDSVRPQFERYAEACDADLVVFTEPPDATGQRNILCQKMLLPDLCRDWERMAFLDLDVLISRDAGSIFMGLPEGAGLAAVVDPRGTTAFVNVVNYLWRLPEILAETHESYFSGRGFPPFPADTPVVGSINGGALVCRPALLADVFKAAYFDGFEMQVSGEGFVQRKIAVHEEAMMAYHAQVRRLFAPLPERFNHQFLYSLMAEPDQPAVRWMQSIGYKLLRRADARATVPAMFYQRAWRDLVRRSLASFDIVHFAGGFPFRGLMPGR